MAVFSMLRRAEQWILRTKMVRGESAGRKGGGTEKEKGDRFIFRTEKGTDLFSGYGK
jgi:hypothetical protein